MCVNNGEEFTILTRLKVDGFKNLDRVDIRLGPFSCIAGPNGAGKSNLFDAILFLAALADKPLGEAALAVRGGDARRGDVRTLFRRAGGQIADRMKFTAELVIPEEGEDALGQAARASMTYLQYELELRYRPDTTIKSMGALELVRESMENFVRAQKKYLDVIAEETANLTNGVTNVHAPGRKTQLPELAREATEAFIDAQKKVLDVYAQQGEVNVKAARGAFEALNPFQPAIVKEFSRNTVENFVNAEKALLDVISKGPRAASHPDEHSAKKAPPRKRSAAAKHQAAAASV